ncbi:hydrogenase small subunit [Methanocella arvoryzae]|nr:hydrogenase small subunit [Methanocella arvoryzae]
MDGPVLPGLGRRAFLALAATTGAAAFLAMHSPGVAAAIADSRKKLLWLRGSGCGGCTASFLNGGYPDVLAALDSVGAVITYHDGLMAQQGITLDGVSKTPDTYNALKKLDLLIDSGDYVLVVEGAIPNGPDGTGKYCTTGGRAVKEIFSEAAEKAETIIALGTCAAFGGISSAGRSVTDARGVAYTGASRFNGILSELNMRKKVINVPGCPAHPDWFLLTLADVLSGAEVTVDDYRRPAAFFSKSAIHDTCTRRGSYDQGQRDTQFAGEGCLYGAGCKGMITYADCPVRRWNGGVSTCTLAGGPCVGCVEAEFPGAFMPFFNRVEDRSLISGTNVDLGAKVILGAAILGAGVHAVKRLAIGDNDNEGDGDEEKLSEKRSRRGR